MKIIIQNSSDVPIYQQIYEQIKASILSAELHEEELLPSIRQLSRELKVSVITTTRAYTDLEKDGYIMIVQGKGCYVQKLEHDRIEEKLLQDMKQHMQQILLSAKILKKSKTEVLSLMNTWMEETDDEHGA